MARRTQASLDFSKSARRAGMSACAARRVEDGAGMSVIFAATQSQKMKLSERSIVNYAEIINYSDGVLRVRRNPPDGKKAISMGDEII